MACVAVFDLIIDIVENYNYYYYYYNYIIVHLLFCGQWHVYSSVYYWASLPRAGPE